MIFQTKSVITISFCISDTSNSFLISSRSFIKLSLLEGFRANVHNICVARTTCLRQLWSQQRVMTEWRLNLHFTPQMCEMGTCYPFLTQKFLFNALYFVRLSAPMEQYSSKSWKSHSFGVSQNTKTRCKLMFVKLYLGLFASLMNLKGKYQEPNISLFLTIAKKH